ncbi:hypothetical protein BAUCODRAFT_64138 [Baudoinia panamericana UAMH 10762]|uniref:Palmitoyltransferase n=1 Tax=Baudoinia panamericana (strain UAMH 10762) TaxID=717646 RepID=M2N5Z1_BAUPA|nr:uncharacterized protein BAUCODRAFT_64138 [Baudoinia panamericana UAMH 10762]EMC99443.1 hypothetical protein BAUCODRAFT_64138 [Baudoinia panamericana UAMH 10762]
MGALKNIVIAIFVLSLLTFVALFGQLPALRKTPIGWLQQALFVHIPNALKRVDQKVTGGRIIVKSKRLGHYLFYERNPIVLIIFLILLTGSSGLFLWHAIHLLPTSLLLPIPLLLGLPYYFTYLCATHTSHYITTLNLNYRLQGYPFDHILYHPGPQCRTCALPKPARSKHCSLCGHCVAKCDHHCPWVNNCLGRGNYRYFLALLLSLGLLQLYGAYLSYYLLYPYFLAHRNRNVLFKRGYWSELGEAMAYAIHRGGLPIAGVGLLAASTAAMPLALLGYHCYLIWAGMTTNESQKWADWRDDMGEGCVFKASRKALKAHNRARRGSEDDEDGDAVGAVRWPVESDQVVVRTNDGEPPVGQEGLWTRVWSLGDVENVYDLGGWDNLVEVLRGR